MTTLFHASMSKLLSANSTATSFALSASGFADMPAGTVTMLDGLRGDYRSIELIFYGDGADDSTFDYRVWLIARLAGSSRVRASLHSYGTATLSTVVGSSLDVVSASERFADTLTNTRATASSPYGHGAAMESAYGASTQVYSPGSNGDAARLIIPDVGGADAVWVDFDLTGATGANALYRLVR